MKAFWDPSVLHALLEGSKAKQLQKIFAFCYGRWNTVEILSIQGFATSPHSYYTWTALGSVSEQLNTPDTKNSILQKSIT